MEKKITISVITVEGNYGREATGLALYYIFLSAQVVLQSRHIQDNYQFPKNTLGALPEAPQLTDSSESAFPAKSNE